MAPRSIWNGTLAFGLVKVPVKVFSATDRNAIAFREIHTKDNSPLQHRRICRAEGKEVPKEEIVKGYEVSEGEYVLLAPEEIKAAEPDRPKTIEIDEFVEVEEIDPFYFTKSYYLGVRDQAAPYGVLADALDRTGKAGIGRFIFHGREYLVAVRARDRVLLMHTLRFRDELLSPGDLDLPAAKKSPTRKEVDMARRLIAGLTEDFEPGEYEDEYQAAVMELIEQKAAGKKPQKKRRKKRRETDDLAAALEESLAAQGAKG